MEADRGEACVDAGTPLVAVSAVHASQAARAIETRVMALAAMLRMELAARGAPALSMARERESHIVAVPLAGRDPVHVLAALKEDGVICSARNGNLRIAPHVYNDETDIRTALTALEAALARFSGDAG
jgi:selenocysteine lyase/cysteine desulfurase